MSAEMADPFLPPFSNATTIMSSRKHPLLHHKTIVFLFALHLFLSSIYSQVY